MSLPTDDKARKDIPIFAGFFKYFPLAISAAAGLSKKSSEQHNPGVPMFWDKTKSKDNLGSLSRHLVDIAKLGEDAKDTDGEYHLTKIFWRAGAALEELLEKKQSIPTQQNLWWAKLEGSEGWLGETKDDKLMLWSTVNDPTTWSPSPYLDGMEEYIEHARTRQLNSLFQCQYYPDCEICGDKVPAQQYAYEDTGIYDYPVKNRD